MIYLFVFIPIPIRNIRRYRRELKKCGNPIAGHLHGKLVFLDFVPTTYVLPADYHLFLEEYRKNPRTWIMKPCGKSQGTGIFLIDKLSQLKKWSKENKYQNHDRITKENYIISRCAHLPLFVLFIQSLRKGVVSFTDYHFERRYCRFLSNAQSRKIDISKNHY